MTTEVDMLDWIQSNEVLAIWLAAGSVFTFFATLVMVPWIIIRLPHDYFVHSKRSRVPWANQHPVLRLFLFAVKNIVGLLFLLAGMLMLVTPGQGILTIAMGIVLIDFPGKFRFERWVVSHRHVYRAINAIRRRAGREAVIVEERR